MAQYSMSPALKLQFMCAGWQQANNDMGAAGFFSFGWDEPQWNQTVSENTRNHFKVLGAISFSVPVYKSLPHFMKSLEIKQTLFIVRKNTEHSQGGKDVK